uniref:Uncharacterized protein n=1 Tax=Scophthalmus maximus TaxID=52904 RepID=A0A8D3A3M3_SCOMX
VFEVQVFGLLQRDEELRVVGVAPPVGHRQDTWARVPDVKVLVLKLASGRVSHLDYHKPSHLTHEVRYDSVEDGVSQSEAFLSGAEGPEVFCRLGHNVGEELDGDGAQCLAVGGHVEEHPWITVSGMLLNS